MENFILAFMNKYGYIAIIILIAVENIFPPIPSEVILTFGGFMTTQTSMNVPLVILFSTIGALIGAFALYYIGKILNKERLKKIVRGKVGKILCLKEKDIDSADRWFDTKGNKTVFFCRFVPIVRSLISIPAGMSEMNIFKFFIYTISGTIIWNTVLVLLGRALGESWHTIVEIMDKYSTATLIILIVLFILVVIYFIKRRKLKKS